MEFERIVWLDPNLKTNFGHPIEAACSVKKYFESENSTEFRLVVNKNADTEVRRLLGNYSPVISNTCFQNLDDKGEAFYRDIEAVNEELKLGPDDLIVVPTSYSNEIIGTKKFVTENRGKTPKFAFQIHQFFPPTSIFEETLTLNYFLSSKRLLSEAFFEINKYTDVISIWSTETQKLNRLLNSIAPVIIGSLPLPIDFHGEFNQEDEIEKRRPTLSFLGDGRYEKGLLLFLSAINSSKNSNERIIVQNYNPRGYQGTEKNSLQDALNRLKSSGKVEVIESALDPVNFQRIVAESDVVIMPYHPKSYDMRISEVYILARLYKRNCIVSSGTWMADESRKFRTGGVFEYHENDSDKTIDNLRKRLENLSTDSSIENSGIDQQAEYYKKTNSPETVINRLKNYYA